jgi:hypothetical protein
MHRVPASCLPLPDFIIIADNLVQSASLLQKSSAISAGLLHQSVNISRSLIGARTQVVKIKCMFFIFTDFKKLINTALV